jgi:phytoene desaturase
MNKKKAIVVGGGIGGIATAIRLSVIGYEVELFEKNEVAGGKMYLIEKDGFRFDAGPSLFTQPANVEELFAFAGESIEEYLSYSPVPIACRYFFENGTIVNAYTEAEAFALEMEQKVGENPQNIIRYLKAAAKTYENVGNIFLNFSLHRWKTWMHPRIIAAMRTIKFPYLLSTLHQFNVKSFKTKEAVQIFNRFATYNGSNPYKAPGMLSLIPHLEQNEGTFYPAGGMINIPNALIGLAKKKGVKFRLGETVDKIIVDRNKAMGIVSGNNNHLADLVVSNVDVYYTYKNLLNSETGASKILRNERSSSALIFYWGIKKEFKQLHLHNILFSELYEEEFTHLFSDKKFFHDPTVYINITSKMEAGQAPEGCENWFVMINAPAMQGADWPEEVKKVRGYVITKLNRMLGVDLNDFIEVEEVLTPAGIQMRTDSYLGSLYGTSSNSRWAAFLRHANYSSSIEGLFFTGGSVHPGGGIPLCLKSAKIVCDLIGH